MLEEVTRDSLENIRENIKEKHPDLHRDIEEVLATNPKSLEIYELLKGYPSIIGRIGEFFALRNDSTLILENGERYIVNFNGMTLPITRGQVN